MANKDHGRKIQISAVIIARNAQNTIADCIKSLLWTDEIIVIDSGSEDKTIGICEKLGCRVFSYNKGSYPDWRNVGKEKAGGRFLIYLDTDEVINGELKEEIEGYVNNWPEGTACFASSRCLTIPIQLTTAAGRLLSIAIRTVSKFCASTLSIMHSGGRG